MSAPAPGHQPVTGPLGVREVSDAVVYPTIRVPSHPGRLLMGVYDADGYVERTVLDRRSGEKGAPVPRDLLPEVRESGMPEAIYAGELYYHFGHFLLECLARTWYAQRYPDLPLVWAGAHTWQGFELRTWQREVLDVLGITNPTVILSEPTRFDRLHVPDVGYRYDDWFHPEHAAFLARFAGPPQVAGERLWLSRSKLSNDARDLNAEATERHLADAGWTVIHPETLSVHDQLDHLARAEVVAGEEGSAFHLVALLEDLSSKRLEIFRRRGDEHPNLITIGDARGIHQTFHTLKRQQLVKAEGRVVTKVTPRSSETLDILEVPVRPAPARDPRPDDEVLRQAVEELAPTRILEVGAPDADLLLGSTANRRVAVSPRLGFDPRVHAESGIAFFETDLERYATYFHRSDARFDVVRLAEPDLESLLATFETSKELAHDGTVWLLGTDDLAARAAVAVRILHPGYTARRVFVKRTAVYVVSRIPGEPRKEVGVTKLSAAEIAKRARRLPITRLRRLRARAERATEPS